MAQERIDKLKALGFLSVEQEKFSGGQRNIYTCEKISVIVSRMTNDKVTPKKKKLQKSQITSNLRKSKAIDSKAVNQSIKDMAKSVTGKDLSDDEVMQFVFYLASEKLNQFGWDIDNTVSRKDDADDSVKPEEQSPQDLQTPNNLQVQASEQRASNGDGDKGVEHKILPWNGDTFIKNRLSENAYQWALNSGATDWRHACCLVWEKLGVTPLVEIEDYRKPLSIS
ncbi:hypothetical protein [Raoultella terrigena]|uniref:Uncharacterized protein n=1 Tax=Raoultella terrigena TaxID=577 RepID=A0AAP9XPC9_RAOTE|nr:hypothetical protein [Raoultella terrigena]QPF08297.1 hypothetical protein IMO34_23870 [Raoultella terrigena]